MLRVYRSLCVLVAYELESIGCALSVLIHLIESPNYSACCVPSNETT